MFQALMLAATLSGSPAPGVCPCVGCYCFDGKPCVCGAAFGRCECYPACAGRGGDPKAVPVVYQTPEEAPPPQWVLDRLREHAAKHDALAGKHQTLATEVAQLKADVQQVKQDTATGISEIKELLKAGRPAAAADPPKADAAAAVLKSIDASLKQLVAQRVTPAPTVPAVTARVPFPAGATTPGTPALTVGAPNSYSPDQPAVAVTYTLAPGAGLSGATSGGGCSSGGCSTGGSAGRVGLFGRRR